MQAVRHRGDTKVKQLIKVVFLLALAPAAGAQSSAGEDYVWNEMKGEKLLALKAKGDPLRGEISFEICQGCHRADASGRKSGAYPRLAGQHATVLIKQMTDIRAGRRYNPKMDPFIGEHAVTPQEIADIATFLAGLPIPADNGKGNGAAVTQGKQLYERDCADCHGAKGEGRAAEFFPMLAGQHFKYLVREGLMIRDGDRRNSNPKMVKAIKAYSDSDIEAVSDYMSQLAPPKK
jgi:cytochrome c553